MLEKPAAFESGPRDADCRGAAAEILHRQHNERIFILYGKHFEFAAGGALHLRPPQRPRPGQRRRHWRLALIIFHRTDKSRQSCWASAAVEPGAAAAMEVMTGCFSVSRVVPRVGNIS